jgi:hypothetical protein
MAAGRLAADKRLVGMDKLPEQVRTLVLVGIAVFCAAIVLVSVLVVQSTRPAGESKKPSAKEITATGKCAECHRQNTPGIVHHYEDSVHFAKGVTCLDCHNGDKRPDGYVHNGFTIVKKVTSGSCAGCHKREYEEFVRSRHAAPSWTAVRGNQDFTPAQMTLSRRFHPPEVMDRPANVLALQEGQAAISRGCMNCHDIGRPNVDGSIGSCIKCHATHSTSTRLARLSETCGACHVGPDHPQIEIWEESKHGVVFKARAAKQNLDADPKSLSLKDNDTPTCATCHMSGLEGEASTHDVGERLSYYLADPVSKKRPNFETKRRAMQVLCLKCHSSSHVDAFYASADKVLESTNEKFIEIKKLMDELYDKGLLTKKPFDESIEFAYYELWHHHGRTAKHGAYMGGADFVQWHGFYEIEKLTHEIREFHKKPK